MAYRNSPRTISQVETFLDQMVKSNDALEWIFPNPSGLAYRLWEALKFARKNPKEFAEYSKLSDKFRLRVIEPNILRAEPRLVAKDGTLEAHGMILREVGDVLHVIMKATEFKADMMIFPDAELEDEDDVGILSAWCENNGYELNTEEQLKLIKKVGNE